MVANDYNMQHNNYKTTKSSKCNLIYQARNIKIEAAKCPGMDGINIFLESKMHIEG